ncbi:MAG TPA: transposase, partial [Nitrospirae bacterium]|nr:transposase [Nitrospirota bacterium]
KTTMARRPRIEFSGALYHVIIRGNRQQNIFGNNRDRLKFLELLRRYRNQHGFLLYAYVLMSNHVHLLIETRRSPLSRIMQCLNTAYTQHFNRQHKKVGHLFQGRYKAILCDQDAYLVALVRYIHQNPVQAKLVETTEAYRWSSHHDYVGKNRGFVDTECVLRLFSEKRSVARKQYAEFVNQFMGRSDSNNLYATRAGQILGDDQFIDKVENQLETLTEVLRKPSLKELIAIVSDVCGVEFDVMRSRVRQENVSFARGVLVLACREVGLRLSQLQKEINRDLSALTRWSRAAENKQGKNTLEKVLKRLNA